MKRIDVKDVTVIRKDKILCTHVNFSINENDYVALMGANGSGKTTLLRVILGVIQPFTGQILVEGEKNFDNDKTGIIHQHDSLSDYLTVKQYMKLECKLAHADKNYCEYLAEYMKLTEWMNKDIAKLSYGTKRKLSLWKALIKKPELLLMDEPTTGLDENIKEQVWDILLELKKKGTTAIIATNSEEEAIRLCNRLLYLENQTIKEKSLLTLRDK